MKDRIVGLQCKQEARECDDGWGHSGQWEPDCEGPYVLYWEI